MTFTACSFSSALNSMIFLQNSKEIESEYEKAMGIASMSTIRRPNLCYGYFSSWEGGHLMVNEWRAPRATSLLPCFVLDLDFGKSTI